MANIEIDSFIKQFKLLRIAGVEALLSLETKLDEVMISLNCKVGRSIPPPQPRMQTVCSNKKYRSPSYYRRQVRRKAERKAQSILTM